MEQSKELLELLPLPGKGLSIGFPLIALTDISCTRGVEASDFPDFPDLLQDNNTMLEISLSIEEGSGLQHMAHGKRRELRG